MRKSFVSHPDARQIKHTQSVWVFLSDVLGTILKLQAGFGTKTRLESAVLLQFAQLSMFSSQI